MLLKSDNIILTGFMGSGKSHLAHYLAQKSGFWFLDTDDLIESEQQRSIKEIFASNGESYFRAMEAQVSGWIARNVRQSIVATGGGLPIYYEDVTEMGTVFYMDISFDAILARMDSEQKAKRPLFTDESKARELFSEREAHYKARAHYHIDATMPLDEMVSFVAQKSGLFSL